jgi:hypothetical protein
MLYLYGETPLVNCGPRSILLYTYYHLLQALFTFRKHYFTLPQTNISFHTICLILCYQQTSEIDNLTASWGKVVWLCCEVPRCCWRRSHVPDCFLAPLPKSASNNLQKWFLSPTGRLNFGFITKGKLTAMLIIPSSWGFPTGPLRQLLPAPRCIFFAGMIGRCCCFLVKS